MNESSVRFQYTGEDTRLDLVIAKNSDISRSRAVELIESGYVSVNGAVVQAKKRLVVCRDEIEINVPVDQEIDALPQDIPLDVIYEDKDLIVINKPQGMVVHPAPGNPDNTLVNALLFHCGSSLSGINGKLRPGIVHRIDKDTSGLLVAAKTDQAHSGLSALIKKHDFTRRYYAIVYGSLPQDEGTVRSGIGRSTKNRKKMASFPVGTPNTKEAVTHYKVLERINGYSFVELTLETGRTHQIRVHMQSLGCPVVDDPLYATGRKAIGSGGQILHAGVLGFKHPITGEEMIFTASLPPHFIDVLMKLGFHYES